MMSVFADEEAILTAYEDVRDDSTSTQWLLLEYNDDKKIYLSATGVDYNECTAHLNEEKRAYIYLRLVTGDEMSKRSKFVLLTWIGFAVPPLKKARVSTDKAFVKERLPNFAKEFLCSEKADLIETSIRSAVEKAGGAHYGTGK